MQYCVDFNISILLHIGGPQHHHTKQQHTICSTVWTSTLAYYYIQADRNIIILNSSIQQYCVDFNISILLYFQADCNIIILKQYVECSSSWKTKSSYTWRRQAANIHGNLTADQEYVTNHVPSMLRVYDPYSRGLS